MAEAVDFEGSNFTYTAPKGQEDRVGELKVFRNGLCIVSAWRPSPEELKQINETGLIFASSLSGGVLYPLYIGSEQTVAAVVSDTGKVWR